ncbi:hypothetical protein DESC_940042 [Desulfosarcina cetonica]|nr:hypothetical protein DESC_940042 [Desulfosarcina cetonica]
MNQPKPPELAGQMSKNTQIGSALGNRKKQIMILNFYHDIRL